MSALRYWRGRWRLAWRLCPECNSSPPRPTCPVCDGSYDYGAHASELGGPLSDERKQLWRSRWEWLKRREAAR